MPIIKLRTFDGSRKPGIYRDWKREISTTQMIYGLTHEQLAPLVYLALESGEGRPRELLNDIDAGRPQVRGHAGHISGRGLTPSSNRPLRAE